MKHPSTPPKSHLCQPLLAFSITGGNQHLFGLFDEQRWTFHDIPCWIQHGRGGFWVCGGGGDAPRCLRQSFQGLGCLPGCNSCTESDRNEQTKSLPQGKTESWIGAKEKGQMMLPVNILNRKNLHVESVLKAKSAHLPNKRTRVIVRTVISITQKILRKVFNSKEAAQTCVMFISLCSACEQLSHGGSHWLWGAAQILSTLFQLK